MEKVTTKERERDTEATATADEQTAVPTPERADSINGKQDQDLEKAIAEQRDGLPAPIEIPDGGWKAWLTVIGACVSLLLSVACKMTLTPHP